MPHDVFISYSTHDKVTADAITAYLEAAGIRCWVAPRDILPGSDWGASIIEAIENSRAMVLIYSASANDSPQIKREVERAVNKAVPLIPFRIQDVPPSKSLEYFISTPHWLDALTPPLEGHLNQLTRTVRALIATRVEGVTPATGPARGTATKAPAPPDASLPYAPNPKAPARWTLLALGCAAAVLLLFIALAGLFVSRSTVTVAASRPAVFTPTPIPIPVSPTPLTPAPAPRPQADEAAVIIQDLERLDARLVLLGTLLADKPATALTDDDAQAVLSKLDFSDSSPDVRLNICWNDFDRVRELTALGATEPDVRAFIAAANEAHESHRALFAQIEEIARRNRLAALARDFNLPRDPPTSGAADTEAALSQDQLATAVEHFNLRTLIAYTSGLHLASTIPTRLPDDTLFRLLKLTHLSPANYRDQPAIAAARSAARKTFADVEAKQDALEDRERELSKATIDRLLAAVPAPLRPAPADPDAAYITAARQARAANQPAAAAALYAALAERSVDSDPNAEAYYRTALALTRHPSDVPPTGGLYLLQTSNRSQFTPDGLTQGDVLLTFNGKPLSTPTDLAAAIKESAGQPAEVTLLRLNDKSRPTKATLPLRFGDPSATFRPI